MIGYESLRRLYLTGSKEAQRRRPPLEKVLVRTCVLCLQIALLPGIANFNNYMRSEDHGIEQPGRPGQRPGPDPTCLRQAGQDQNRLRRLLVFGTFLANARVVGGLHYRVCYG
ncbi:hypothetical protein ES703_55306 [subsurface metagenome]